MSTKNVELFFSPDILWPMSRHSDKELWVISGRKPVDFDIPIYVIRKNNEATVTPACHLLTPQREALNQFLATGGVIVGGTWNIHLIWLKRHARGPVAGEPEEYLVWGKVRRTKIEVDRDFNPVSKDRKEFLDYIYYHGATTKRPELDLQWLQFCQSALNYLLVERKPVDMYFITLHPMPYRPNWKCVLLSRFKNIGKIISSTSEAKRQALMIESGLTEEMLCLDLISYNHKHGYCNMIVEVEHKKSWWRKVKQAELGRLIKQNSYGYCASFLDFVKRQLPVAQRLYVSWLAQIARLSPATDETEFADKYRFITNTGNSTVRLERPPIVSCDPVVPDKLPIHTGSSSARDLLETYAVLPDLPGVQPEVEDMRDDGGDLPEPADAKT